MEALVAYLFSICGSFGGKKIPASPIIDTGNNSLKGKAQYN
jgi:hypothetical protein